MKAQVERDELRDAVKRVLPAVRPATWHEWTQGLLLSAAKDTLTVEGTDLDTTITTTAPAEVGEPGDAVVPARLFDRLLSKARKGPIEITLDAEHLAVSAGRLEATLRTFDAAAWPQLPTIVGERATFDAETWETVGRVLHAASTDRSRPVLTGVCFAAGAVFATDSYRIAHVAVDHAIEGVAVPADLLRQVQRVAGESVMEVVADQRAILFTDGTTEWRGCLIGGETPTVASFIEMDSPYRVACDRQELADALGSVDVFAGLIKLTLTDGQLRVSMSDPDTGAAETTIDAEGDMGHTLAFNVVYLADLVDHVTSERIELRTTNEYKPVVVHDGAFTGVVMPVRVA